MVSVPPSGRWLSESVRLVTGLSEAPVCGATLATLFTSSIVVIYFPELICARPPTLFLSWMLMTPAMASEPYCDEAPSRSTSIRSIAIGGIVFMSTPDEPRPPATLRYRSRDMFRRLPLPLHSTRNRTTHGDGKRSIRVCDFGGRSCLG